MVKDKIKKVQQFIETNMRLKARRQEVTSHQVTGSPDVTGNWLPATGCWLLGETYEKTA